MGIVTALDVVAIGMAMLVGGAIGLLLAVAHYEHAAAQRQQYEQEIAHDAERYIAAQAALQRYRPARRPDNNATVR